MKRLLGDRLSITFALWLIGLVGLGGSAFLYTSYVEVRSERPELALNRLRAAFIGFAELERFTGLLDKFAPSTRVDDDDRAELERRLDIVYVRLAEFERDRDFAALASTQQLTSAMRSIVERVDRLIAEDFRDLQAERQALSNDLRAASASLIEIANVQHRREQEGVERQTDTLQQMIIVMEVLIGLFVGISIVVLILLRREKRARSKIAKAEAQSRYLAFFDILTALPNRAFFHEKAATEIGATDEPAVAIVDIDDFKNVNDRHGHAVGDALLVGAAQRLRSVAKNHGGVVARLGGDEFAAMLPRSIGDEGLRRFCADVVETLRQPLAVKGVELTPKTSVGAVLGQADGDAWSVGKLLKAADKALYAAKAQGKNAYVVFDEALRRELVEEAELQAGIDRAIADDELFLVYQPQVDITDGSIVGVEALVRWRRGDAVAPPGVFINAAEKSGKIRDIDYAVLEKAGKTLADWRAAGLKTGPISVNLSAAHFSDNVIVDRVSDVIERYDVPPSLLTLEITETMLLDDWDRVEAVIEQLHGLGVNLALDDFGTGYSSIGYLRRLRVHELKIDRSMVLDVEASEQCRALLSTMADLAAAFGMKTVVEGVETAAQAALLRDLGFRVAQGFLYAAPVAEGQATAWLSAGHRLTPSDHGVSAA